MSLTLAATLHTRLDAEMESDNSLRRQLTKESMSKDAYRYSSEVTQRYLSNLLFHYQRDILKIKDKCPKLIRHKKEKCGYCHITEIRFLILIQMMIYRTAMMIMI